MTKTMKKLFAVLVSAALLVSCFAFTGNAWGTPTGTEAMTIGLTLDKTEANPGDTVTVTVRLANNYNAVTMRWPVLFSKAFFELDGEKGGLTAPINSVVAVPGSVDAGTSADFIPAAYAADYDALTIQWIASGDATNGVGAFNSAEAVDCFTFNLKVKDDAEGTGSVFIPADSDYFYYTGINDPMDATTSYSSATPFNFTVGAAQTVTAIVAQNDPVLTAADGFNVRIVTFDDDDTEYLIGFDATEIIDNGGDYRDQFVVTDGTYTVSDDMLTTGGTVTVYDSNGNVYKTYTTIFFGDVNGDATIDISDASEIIYLMEYVYDEPELTAIYAADVDPGDETYIDINSIDITDYSQLIYAMEYAIEWNDLIQTHIPV